MDKATEIKIVTLMLGITLFIFITDVYFYFIAYFVDTGFASTVSIKFIRTMHNIGYLSNNYLTKAIIGIPLFFAVLGNTPKRNHEVSLQSAILITLLALILLLVVTPSTYYYLYLPQGVKLPLYVFLYIVSIILLLNGLTRIMKVTGLKKNNDLFNEEAESFLQCEEKIENKLSVNIQSDYYYKKQWRKGWINIVGPTRSTMILGKPGSGKSYSFVEEIMKQHIQKGFAFVNYDYKFPTLTNIAYSYLTRYQDAYSKYPKKVQFGIINLDDPRYSNRCNPIHPSLLRRDSDIIDAVYTIFYNIDKNSVGKEDFFKMSAAAITSACLLFLKIYQNGKYCSLPHLIQFLNAPYKDVLTILGSYPQLSYFTGSFSDALENKAFEQLSGQVASAKIPLAKLVTPEMFYVMTDPDNTGLDLRVNHPDYLSIINIANNPETQKTNGPANGLYMSQIAKLINKQGRIPCEFMVDELPTIFINGLDNLIATARSNDVAVTLSFQDLAQLERDYGREIASAIFNTVSNIISGNVVGDTAKKISETIGRIHQERQSISIDKEGSSSTSISTQLDSLVPASKISQLSQGEFVGVLVDTFKEPLPIKVFKAKVSPDKSDLDESITIPVINELVTDKMLRDNMLNIQDEIRILISDELKRIGDESD